jgi:hypothetical protein
VVVVEAEELVLGLDQEMEMDMQATLVGLVAHLFLMGPLVTGRLVMAVLAMAAAAALDQRFMLLLQQW